MPVLEGSRLGDLNNIMISEHFRLSEFECMGRSCCGYAVKVEPLLIEWLERLRAALSEKFGREVPLRITSGYRCPEHNLAVGGVTHSMDPLDTRNSFHCQGMAADVASPGLEKELIARVAVAIGIPRVGFYQRRSGDGTSHNVVHLDIADPAAIGTPAVFGSGWGPNIPRRSG